MIKYYLKQPYSRVTNNWKLTITISLFIALFLLLFEPFGLSAYESYYKSLVICGYGGVTFLILLFNLFVVKAVFGKWFSDWTVLKQVIWLSWIVFSIGAGNYFYTSIIFPSLTGFSGFLIFQIFTIIVGVFPIVTLTLISYNIKLSRNLKFSDEVNTLLEAKPNGSKPNGFKGDEIIVLIADNNKDKIETELSNLLYIESTGNYVEVVYYKEGKLIKELMRATIKRIESDVINFSSLVKCHRAFIVNINNAQSVKGNTQDLKLVLKNCDLEIPVSRSKAQKIKNSLY